MFLVEKATSISELNPSMWLSASNFDGAHPTGEEVITGDASGGTMDSLGNVVTSTGTIRVLNDGGYSAYYFDKTNSITSAAKVSDKYTFVSVFRRPTLRGDLGRFFTSSEGDRLFCSDGEYLGKWYLDNAWVYDQEKSSTQIEFYIAINNNGSKNMWDERLNQQLVINKAEGANEWGQTVIGKPILHPEHATAVYIYEALVFEYPLDHEQRELIESLFKIKYCIYHIY